MTAQVTYRLDPSATEASATHMLHDGAGGWIPAKAVHIDMPDPDVDGAQSGVGWEFRNAADLIRWLHAPDEEV